MPLLEAVTILLVREMTSETVAAMHRTGPADYQQCAALVLMNNAAARNSIAILIQWIASVARHLKVFVVWRKDL